MRNVLLVIALMLLIFSALWYFESYSEEFAVSLGYEPPTITRSGELQSPGVMTWLPLAFDIFNSVIGVLGLGIGIFGLIRR